MSYNLALLVTFLQLFMAEVVRYRHSLTFGQ